MAKTEETTSRAAGRSATQGDISKDEIQLKPPKRFAWIAAAATVSLMIIVQFLPRGHNPTLRGIGVFLLLLAAVFVFPAFYLLVKHGRTGNSLTKMEAGIVVDRGLYAIIRHPQYLGYVFLGCGFALLHQHWVLVLLAVVAATFFYLQAVREEETCLAKFGAPYERYRQRVPRFNVPLGVVRLLRGSGGRS